MADDELDVESFDAYVLAFQINLDAPTIDVTVRLHPDDLQRLMSSEVSLGQRCKFIVEGKVGRT